MAVFGCQIQRAVDRCVEHFVALRLDVAYDPLEFSRFLVSLGRRAKDVSPFMRVLRTLGSHREDARSRGGTFWDEKGKDDKRLAEIYLFSVST